MPSFRWWAVPSIYYSFGKEVFTDVNSVLVRQQFVCVTTSTVSIYRAGEREKISGCIIHQAKYNLLCED